MFYSSCYIVILIVLLLISSGVDENSKCLVNVPTNSFSDNRGINFQYPGQIWGPNDQCQLSFGPSSTFCQVWLHFLLYLN